MINLAMQAQLMAGGGVAPTTPHRYWRIFINANNGSDRTAIQEVELYTVASPSTDITNPAMATAFSSYTTYSGGVTARGLIDNDFTNYTTTGPWVSGTATFPQWASIDLGAGNAQAVTAWRIWPQNYSEGGIRGPRDFVIQWSDDNSTWTDVRAFAGISGWTAGQGIYFPLS